MRAARKDRGGKSARQPISKSAIKAGHRALEWLIDASYRDSAAANATSARCGSAAHGRTGNLKRRPMNLLKVAVLTLTVALAACSRAPTDADIKQSVEKFMTLDNGRSVDPLEPYVNLDHACSSLGQQGGRAEFQSAARVVETAGPKRAVAQGLSNWYAKTVWPVKVELRLQCEGGGSAASITATQDFEIEYDGNNGLWTVGNTRWGPWAEDPSAEDVFMWELYTALLCSLAVSVIAASASRPGGDRLALGITSGASAGLFATIVLGLYVGFSYRILLEDGSPGIETALLFAFAGLFIGTIGGLVGASIGAWSGSRLGRRH